MALVDLLVHVDHGTHYDKCLDLAFDLAQVHQARLTGLYIMTLPNTPNFVPMELVRRQIGVVRRQADAMAARFEALAARTGVNSEWSLVDNTEKREDVTDVVRRRGFNSDLVIISQSIPDGSESSVPMDLPNRLVLETGRPVIVVPYAWRYQSVGERVMIAWNYTRESCRALNDTLPILEKARHVKLLSLRGGKDFKKQWDSGQDGTEIAGHLGRHGVQVDVEALTVDDIDVGDMLLSTLASDAIDLLVMGAYGHSRMREMVLGGATRHLLHHMTVPVLMAH